MVINPTSTGPDGAGFMDVTLAGPAPASGERITVTSSDPAIAQIVSGSQPVVSGSCTTSVGNIVFRTPKNVPKTETITGDHARAFGAIIGKALAPLASWQVLLPVLVALQ